MKKVISAVMGISGLIALGLFLTGSKRAAVSEAAKANEALATGAAVRQQEAVKSVREPRESKSELTSRREAAAGTSTTSRRGLDLNEAIETVVSPRASYAQNQAAWSWLRDAGQLDQAISELEKRAANDPQRAEYVAALGEAYMKKCAGMDDVREQAIFAMKADKSLETALKLDPSNWEARFMKAVGMSYWPANLNRSPEVAQEFLTLIQQQEGQPKEPQFAQPYIWLGKEYEKAGEVENAAQIWKRGAALFPENKELQNKVASAQQ